MCPNHLIDDGQMNDSGKVVHGTPCYQPPKRKAPKLSSSRSGEPETRMRRLRRRPRQVAQLQKVWLGS